MTIKQQGGIFGRNPTFNDVDVEGTLTVNGEPISDFGTIATQDADAVAITGGAIDGTPIGGTTRSTGSFTNSDCTIDAFGEMAKFAGPNGLLFIENPATNQVRLRTGGSDALHIAIGGTTNQAVFPSSGGLSMINSNVAFDSGYGIDFSATSGTGTSELFDDYEEGSWSPVVADAATGGNTASITVVGAKYIKIGKIVHLYARINNINTAGMTSGNAVSIQGLPFASGVDVFSCGSCVLDRIGAGGDTTINPKIDESLSIMQFAVTSSASGTSDANLLVSQIGSTGSDIHSLQITYEAS